MENLIIEKTNKTPDVFFDFKNHYLQIKGISIPEDSENFYRPLMEWVEEYVTYMHLKTQAEPTEETQTQELVSETLASEDLASETLGSEAPTEILGEPNITVSLKLIYFNTSTADYIVNLLRKLREIQTDYPTILDNSLFNPDDAPAHWVTVEWCYEVEDEDMLDTGTHFESVLEMPFTYIAVDEII